VSVGVEYPALLSTVDCVGVVGFILRLKAQVFSLILYNGVTEYTHATPTLNPGESKNYGHYAGPSISKTYVKVLTPDDSMTYYLYPE
jgi:hypothetical protein